jgi:hypothetical protein
VLRSRLVGLLPFVIAAGISFAAYGRVQLPALWGSLTWSLACFSAMAVSRSRYVRIALFNVGAVVLIAGLTEAYVWWTDSSAESRHAHLEISNPDGLYTSDPTLGYRPAPSHRTSARFYYGNELIYDVAYTFDADGLRIGPPGAVRDSDACVLFFGCSYTFGAGVNDDEAMPYVVGTQVQGRYRVRNFGYSGYGPHQMLAAIEDGLVDKAAHCQPAYAIYLALPHHALRASGRWWNDTRGPRFVLRPSGEVVRDGNFGDGGFSDWFQRLLGGSTAAMRLLGDPPATELDVDLLHHIVHDARDRLRARFPAVEFHVLYWDIGGPELFTNEAETAGIPVHRLSKLLTNNPAELERTYQIKYDGHPNARTHAIIADYVVNQILHAGPRGRAAVAAGRP